MRSAGEQVVTQNLLFEHHAAGAGLTQYSVNLGKIRDDYGLESNQYGPMLGRSQLPPRHHRWLYAGRAWRIFFPGMPTLPV